MPLQLARIITNKAYSSDAVHFDANGITDANKNVNGNTI